MNIEKLEDHIDEPIKKCVVGMALLGFEPAMSCCGFSYKGEKVAKEHLKKVYMYLKYPSMSQVQKALLLDISAQTGWNIKVLNPANYVDFFADTWGDNHPWSKRGCVHNYEVFLLAIHSLERYLESIVHKFSFEATITDGNEDYKKTIKHWQYEPTEPWKVNLETFNSL